MDAYNWRRPLKLHELLEELDSDEIPVPPDGLIIFPPENANDDVTDCDSGDEELTTINNLPGSQLRNDVELVFDNATKLPQDSVNSSLPEEDSDDDNIPLALFLSKEKLPHQLEKRISAHWIQGDLYQHPDCTYWKTQFGPKMTQSPMEIFNLFFDDEVINLVTEYTNIYAGQRNLLNDITQNEIRCFIGVLVLSGYVVVPKRKLFLQQQETAKDMTNLNAKRPDEETDNT
ncbi:piggyBac transposable element-derived protein 3-like [Diabrotica virgifera virgifera]|uniref:PiggyBac transposable element-derived protein domain-containing protein n=1 Tax=Diabrotica virgifera virgifera TaxID=50390 RepID=A0ABM5KS07_DIAVI|nr:piggyBac transposable element-derived protein 3-like [Diabrotica virgifera virgifera]